MKTEATLAMLAAVVGLSGTTVLAQAPKPAPRICLEGAAMASMKGEADGNSIMILMKDGSKWRTRVEQPCTGLANSLIAYTTNSDNALCEGPTTPIWVQAAAHACKMSKFERIPTGPLPDAR